MTSAANCRVNTKYLSGSVYRIGYGNILLDMQPSLPVPGTVIDRDDGSAIPFQLAPYMGQSFTQFCKLAPLINNIPHGSRLPADNSNLFELAEETYSRLLQWADSLPTAMGPGTDMPHHVAVVQWVTLPTVV